MISMGHKKVNYQRVKVKGYRWFDVEFNIDAVIKKFIDDPLQHLSQVIFSSPSPSILWKQS